MAIELLNLIMRFERFGFTSSRTFKLWTRLQSNVLKARRLYFSSQYILSTRQTQCIIYFIKNNRRYTSGLPFIYEQRGYLSAEYFLFGRCSTKFESADKSAQKVVRRLKFTFELISPVYLTNFLPQVNYLDSCRNGSCDFGCHDESYSKDQCVNKNFPRL